MNHECLPLQLIVRLLREVVLDDPLEKPVVWKEKAYEHKCGEREGERERGKERERERERGDGDCSGKPKVDTGINLALYCTQQTTELLLYSRH